jgi:hypothetical protein
MLSRREGAESDERDDAFLIRQRSVLADHPLRLLVGQAVVVVGHRAGRDEHVADARADVGCTAAPYRPASIASSRVITHERDCSASRQRAATARDSPSSV